MNLSANGFTASTYAESDRLRQTLSKRQKRRTRSQYTVTRPPIYDAEQGHAEVQLNGGGFAYAQRITNAPLGKRAAVSLPIGRTVGFVDAKPAS